MLSNSIEEIVGQVYDKPLAELINAKMIIEVPLNHQDE